MTCTLRRYHYKSEDGHTQVADRYRAGDGLTVFPHPESPTRSMIEKGWSCFDLIRIFISRHAHAIREEHNFSNKHRSQRS